MSPKEEDKDDSDEDEEEEEDDETGSPIPWDQLASEDEGPSLLPIELGQAPLGPIPDPAQDGAGAHLGPANAVCAAPFRVPD